MLAVAFLFPMVLAAAGAAAVPVIIHLILRTKPRKIIFPAMRFVRKTHQANLSKLRLKHLLLLLMRMAAIAAAAALIARPQLQQWATAADADVPAAAVILVDCSGSMNYIHRGQALLDRGKQFARQVVESLPAGSRVAVLSTEAPAGKVSFLADRKQILDQLLAVEGGYGTRPVGPALARAIAALDKEELGRREVFIISDMTAWSWRELKAVTNKNIRFIVLNCSPGEDANIALGELRLESTAVPEGAEVVVETLLRSMQVSGEADVRAELNGQVADSKSVALRPGSAAALSLTFTPRQRGLAHGRVFLSQADPLAMDNVRYFTLAVGPPAGLLVIRDPATVGRGDPTSFLMASAAAPSGAAAWIRRETTTADRLDGARLREMAIVLLCDVSSLTQAQWKTLEAFCRDGGHVWVVIGSLISAASYNSAEAQRVLPATFGELEVLSQPAVWQPARRGEPLLEPFTSDANPPLTEIRCDRRFRLPALSPGARTVLAFADNQPAILTRAVGDGSVVLWNFSPVREFSNLAGRAQFPVLAQRTVRLLAGRTAEQTLFTWGQTATVAIPKGMDSAMMTIRRPGEGVDQAVVRSLIEKALSFQADRLGNWTVQFADGPAKVQRGFSVNADFAESDLTAVSAEDLAGLFPPDRLVVASEMADLTRLRRMVTEPLDLAVPLLLGLLVLLIAESFFANRFYRQDASHQEAGQEG